MDARERHSLKKCGICGQRVITKAFETRQRVLFFIFVLNYELTKLYVLNL
jgi:hypothetical protein